MAGAEAAEVDAVAKPVVAVREPAVKIEAIQSSKVLTRRANRYASAARMEIR